MTYRDDFNPFERQTPRHSGLGIASFVIALCGGLLMFLVIVIAGILGVAKPDSVKDETTATMILGMAVIGSCLVVLLGVILGVVALFQSDRSKLFAVLGLSVGGVVLFGTCFLMILGMAMS